MSRPNNGPDAGQKGEPMTPKPCRLCGSPNIRRTPRDTPKLWKCLDCGGYPWQARPPSEATGGLSGIESDRLIPLGER